MRQDAKTDLFDRVYFHSADRIAREAAHQTVIIGELVKRGKQITTALAQSTDCTRTLLPASTDIKFNEVTNLSLAWSLNEGAWNEARQNFGASAVVYGVPISANYGDFKKNVKTRAEQLQLQDFEKRAYAYATSALTPENAKIFSACVAGTQGGLDVAAGAIGTDHYQISIFYRPPIGDVARDRRGRVGSNGNIDPQSLNLLRREIGGLNFAREVWQQPLLRPVDKNRELAVEIVVGPTSKSLRENVSQSEIESFGMPAERPLSSAAAISHFSCFQQFPLWSSAPPATGWRAA